MIRRTVLLLLILFGYTGLALAQTGTFRVPDCSGIVSFTAVGTSNLIPNTGPNTGGCTDWVFSYNTDGFSGITFEIVDAPRATRAPGTPVAFQGTVTSGANPTTVSSFPNSGFVGVSGFYPYMGIAVTSVTGSGRLEGTLYGWRRSPGAGANGASAVDVAQIGGTPVIVGDPCETATGVTITDSISTSTTIVTGTASKALSICGMGIFASGGAINVAVIEGNTSNVAGTTAACGTNTAKLFWGGTTAAAGLNLTLAAPGFSSSPSKVAYATESRAADNICLLLSAATQVNYWMRYVVPGQ